VKLLKRLYWQVLYWRTLALRRWQFLRLSGLSSWRRRTHEGLHRLSIRGLAAPAWLRPRTSDFDVFREVFLEGAYDMPVESTVRTIIDAGANIGLSSLYFLRRYPDARIVAIEPDPGNAAMARRNLSPYGHRAAVVEAAVWPTAERLSLSRSTFRDGRDWSTRVLPADGVQNITVPGVTIEDLMHSHHLDDLDILKMDIEGAELEVLSGDTSFLARTKCIMIELHEDVAPGCTAAFERATAPYGFVLLQHDKTTIAVRR
jgi:FkbM family methyltransferase